MKQSIRILMIITLVFFFSCLAGYFLLALYYRDGYSLNTWINGVYCTGRTAEEINTELLSRIEAPIVVFTDGAGETYTIDLEQAGYRADYEAALTVFSLEQNPFLWIDNVTLHREHSVLPAVEYDEALLRAMWEALPCVVQERERAADLQIGFDAQNGYYLEDGLGGRLDVERAFAHLEEAIARGDTSFSLPQSCYYDIPDNDVQQELRSLWEKVDSFQRCDLVYDMGAEKVPLTPELMAGFLVRSEEKGVPVTDDTGALMLDQEAIKGFVNQLADAYDTYKTQRSFLSTRGDQVTIKGGNYGTRLNRKKEIAFLEEALRDAASFDGTADIHVPAYEKETAVRGLDDIGSTYIEIDMTRQKLYYYEKGELMLETDVVTGNVSRRMSTPEGVNYVYNKQRNRVLRGPGYASPVKYWMPVNGGIGIHDADWRSEFGGTIYQKNGSHGCINVPKDVMPDLYEMVEMETPVVMYY